MSRSGSHAGRGFRYQDAVGVWLLAKSWSGAFPYGTIIPEGKDDYEARSADCSVLLQVKSRRDHLGDFPLAETAGFIRSLWNRAEACEALPEKLILLLEKTVADKRGSDYLLEEHVGLMSLLRADPRWVTYSGLTQICVVLSPSELASEIVASTLPCTPLAAQIYCGELLKKIGAMADNNGMVKNGQFLGLTMSDVEATIRKIEPMLDFSGMEEALHQGYCEAVDFLTPINNPAFYQGVDTRPGHLAAGLVLERPEARSVVVSSLESRGTTLIKGASGTGKSALMWEAASYIRHSVRWFEVKRGDASSVHLFVRLAQALRASSIAPIGFVFDDIGRGLNELWDNFTKEVSTGNGILLLGSIREEDLFLLTSRSHAMEIRPEGDALVAERIWTQLKDQGKTEWPGWREPWVRSDGLLLEYVHILTRGERLEAVLADQVDRRLREQRDDELAILRVAALAGSAGAVLDASLLVKTLRLSQANLARSLRRLVDEHLVAEPVGGQIRGLHQMRSSVLFDVCHAFPPPVASQTVFETIDSVTSESLRALTVYVMSNHAENASELIKHMANRLENDNDPIVAISMLTGLGQVHIELTLKKWLPEAFEMGLEPMQVTLAVMFAVSGVDFPALSELAPLQAAVRALRTISFDDPRFYLISNLSQHTVKSLIESATPAQLRSLLASLVGVSIPENFQTAFKNIRPNFNEIDLSTAADLLSTVHLIDPQTAISWTEQPILQELLRRVPAEIAWAAPVQVEDAPEGRLLRSAIYHVSESTQKDVHQEVVQLCQMLFGIDPTADVVAVDAIAADRQPSGLTDIPLATKRIHRTNAPPSALPEWNQRWSASAARLVGTESYSTYLQNSKELLTRLIPVLERIVDVTLRCKVPPQKILEKFGEIHAASRLLTPPRDGITRKADPEQFATPLQDVLFNCSAELIRKFTKLPDAHAAFVFWTNDLLKKIKKAENEPWEFIGKPPIEQLSRLREIIESLRLLGAESGIRNIHPTHLWLAQTKKAAINQALRTVKLAADEMLKIRSAQYVHQVKNTLQRENIQVQIHTRLNWEYALPWPPMEVMAIVNLGSSTDWPLWLVENEAGLRSAIGKSRRLWVLPRIEGVVVSSLTVGGVAALLQLPYVIDDWLDLLQVRCLNDIFTRESQRVINLLVEIDGMRTFALGKPGRPALERVVRQDVEEQLLDALMRFEALAVGTPIQLVLSELKEEVSEGRVALAESIAAITHGQVLPGVEMLMNIRTALLEQDLYVAKLSALGTTT